MNGGVFVSGRVLFALFSIILLQIEIAKVKYGNGKFCIIACGAFSVYWCCWLLIAGIMFLNLDKRKRETSYWVKIYLLDISFFGLCFIVSSEFSSGLKVIADFGMCKIISINEI